MWCLFDIRTWPTYHVLDFSRSFGILCVTISHIAVNLSFFTITPFRHKRFWLLQAPNIVAIANRWSKKLNIFERLQNQVNYMFNSKA